MRFKSFWRATSKHLRTDVNCLRCKTNSCKKTNSCCKSRCLSCIKRTKLRDRNLLFQSMELTYLSPVQHSKVCTNTTVLNQRTRIESRLKMNTFPASLAKSHWMIKTSQPSPASQTPLPNNRKTSACFQIKVFKTTGFPTARLKANAPNLIAKT